MGFLSVPNLVPSLIFIANTLGFVTDQFCWIRLLLTASSSRFTAMGIDIGGRGGDNSIILNISVIGAIIRRRRLSEERLLFEERRYFIMVVENDGAKTTND